MYVVFNESGLTEWWDFDKSQTDNRKYYPAPTNIAPGTQCKLVDNKIVVMPQNEVDERVRKGQKEFLITRHISLVNKICENNILPKYSRDDQRNIDRNALHLKALEAIDKERLSKNEEKLLITHKEMNDYINNQLKICRELKDKIKGMSLDELKAFNPRESYAS